MVGGGGVVWAEAGRSATLECQYRAYPEPHVTWTKDGALVTHLGIVLFFFLTPHLTFPLFFFFLLDVT